MSEHYTTVEVFGRTWGGFKAAYSYTHKGPPIATRRDARALADTFKRSPALNAGDFESVCDVRVITTRHSYTKKPGGIYTRVDEHRILKGFDSHTPRQFYRAVNGA